MTGCIYLITNTVNGKRYVGQTTQPLAKRWKGHRADMRRGFNYPLHNALRKYGTDAFIVQSVLAVDLPNVLELLNRLEVYYISKYKTLKPGGYNLELGGRNAAAHPETRAKMSATRLGQKRGPMSEAAKTHLRSLRLGKTGHRHTAEAKAKMSLAQKGKKRSLEFCQRMSDLKQGNKNCVGRKLSTETKAKIAASCRHKTTVVTYEELA